MLYTSEQVTKGIISYIDNEVIAKLPTTGKILAGTAVALAVRNNSTLLNNAWEFGKDLGVVNSDGLMDVDQLTNVLRENANRYGAIVMEYPLIGKLTFTADDVDIARRYIE